MGTHSTTGAWRSTATRTALWEVLADPGTWDAWWPALHGVDSVDGDTVILRFDSPLPGATFSVTVEITERVPQRRLAVASGRGGLRGRGELEIVDEDDAVRRVEFTWAVTTGLLLRFLDPVLRRAGERAGHETLAAAGDRLAVLAGGEPLPHEL